MITPDVISPQSQRTRGAQEEGKGFKFKNHLIFLHLLKDCCERGQPVAKWVLGNFLDRFSSVWKVPTMC